MKFLRIISQMSAMKIFLIAGLMTGYYFLTYFDTGEKLQEQINLLQNEQNTEEAKKKDTEATIKKEDEMQANLAALARDLQVVKAKLPNDLKDTEMISLINKSALNAGIQITSLARKKQAGTRENKDSGSESVEEVVFDLTMEGAFNKFVLFVEGLAREEKVVKIRDFSIERNPSEIADPRVKFSGEVIGFKQAQVAK